MLGHMLIGHCTLMAPQVFGERKDTGLTLLTSIGKRNRKSNSWALIRPCLSKIWGARQRHLSYFTCMLHRSLNFNSNYKEMCRDLFKSYKWISASECEMARSEGQPSEQSNFQAKNGSCSDRYLHYAIRTNLLVRTNYLNSSLGAKCER